MKVLYGTCIFFFYFVKYPIVLGLPLLYFYFDYDNNIFMNILWSMSFILILKDWFFPHDKCECKPKKR